MIKVKLRLKRVCSGKKIMKWNLEKLKGGHRETFAEGVDQHLRTEPQNTRQISVENNWYLLKNAILESGEENIGYADRKKLKKAWVTEQMVNKMEERRKWKNVNTKHGRAMYRKLNNELRKETDRARAKWLANQCSELE